MGKRSRQKKERKEKGEVKLKTPKSEKTSVSLSLNIIRWGTYLALFTPLVISSKFFFPYVGPKSLYFMGLVEIIFFTWLGLIIFCPRYRPRLNLLFLTIALFLVVLTLASIFGVNSSYSFWSKFERMTGVLMMLHLGAFFLVISSVFQKSDWIKIFSISILVGAILSFINFVSENPSMRHGATIGNSSFLGTYLLFCLFFALYLFFVSRKEIKIYSGISFLIIFLALYLSGARAAFLSLLGGLGLLFFLYLVFIPQKSYLKLLGKGLLVCCLLFFLVSCFLVFQPGNIIHQKFIEKASQARLVVWEKAWKGFLERPWLGWGPENFEFVFTRYFNSCMFLSKCGGEIWFDRAHNIVFDTLINSGIIGLLSYLSIFIAMFWILGKQYLERKIEFWTMGIFSVLSISYFVQNLTVFDMVNSYLMLFLVLGFVAGFGFPKDCQQDAQSRKRVVPDPLVVALIFILFIFSFTYFILKPALTDYYVIQSIKIPPSEQRVSVYKKALTTSPLGKYQIRTFFTEQFQRLFHSKKGKQISDKDIQSELNFLSKELKKSISESPLDLRSYLRLGQLYNIWVKYDPSKASEAEKILKKALEISPTNQQVYWTLAQTKIFQGDFQAALSLAEKAKQLEPEVRKSHLIIVQIAKIMGNNDLAKEKAKEAIKIIPSLEPRLKKILKS